MDLTVLLVGCGSIGSVVAREAGGIEGVHQVLLHDEDPERVEALSGLSDVRPAADLEVALEDADVVVEAASQRAVAEVGLDALEAGCDLVVVSVGALADEALRADLEAAARAMGKRIYTPSGAIAGLDGVRSAASARLEAVELETRKPFSSLPEEDVRNLPGDEETVIFEGPAREAVEAFPKNVNVAAALSLNGLGVDGTTVRIIADPHAERNQHTVRARGEFGDLEARVRNLPSPDNPATSYLASLSVVALLRRLTEPLWVG